VETAIRDVATDAVFLKINANDLPVSALVRAAEVVSGSAVWLEPRAGRIGPAWISDVRLRPMVDPVSSERASRRFLVAGDAHLSAAGRGAALWDARGELVALLEEETPDGWRALPAGFLASSLESVLATRTIRHASLGVRASDLSSLLFEGSRPLPLQGAWLRADKSRGLPAVAASGPAAAFLREGDVIERIERDILDGRADVGERLLDYRPGTSVTIAGRRGAQSFQFEIRLGTATSSELLK
jgi:S1-C subfamily serine protease